MVQPFNLSFNEFALLIRARAPYTIGEWYGVDSNPNGGVSKDGEPAVVLGYLIKFACGDICITFSEFNTFSIGVQEELKAALADNKLTLDTEQQVFFYEQDFYILSNFSSFKVHYMGLTFDTAEHAYHYCKFTPEGSGGFFAERREIREIRYNILHGFTSAHDAFKYARENEKYVRKDWNKIKLSVMEDILRAKVEQHPYVKKKLLDTGKRELIENSWRDDFWGWGPTRKGQNHLGKLWMKIREDLVYER